MLTLRGQRLLNALMAGGFTGATLEIELADTGARFALREMLDGSPKHARMLLSSSVARSALLGSTTGRAVLVDCRTALMVASKERDIILALAADSNTRNAINASPVALRAIASDVAGSVVYMAQLMGVPGYHAGDPVALFRQGEGFTNSVAALFMITVSPALASGLVMGGRGPGNAAAIDTTLTAANSLFTRITETYVAVPSAEFRWQDDVLILASLARFTNRGTTGSGIYGLDPGRSRKMPLFTGFGGGNYMVNFVAPRGLWHDYGGSFVPLSAIDCVTFIAK